MKIRTIQMNDIIEPVTEAIGAVEEAKRLRKLHAKGSAPNFEYRVKELAEELFLTLDFLDVNHDTFVEQYIEHANEYD